MTVIENDEENQHKHKLSEDVMRIECWTRGKTIKGRIRDDSIRESWVEPIVEKMMKSRLRWFGRGDM